MHNVASARPILASLICLSLLLIGPLAAHAQLSPERTYYGIDRPIPINVSLPSDHAGEASVAIYDAMGQLKARASVLEGAIDLAAFFPILWDQANPIVLYAQLYAQNDAGEQTDRPIGPPLVLQPLLTPQRAVARGNSIEWQSGPRQFSGLRIYTDKLMKLDTTEGVMVFRLRPDEAPNTVWHIRGLVEGGFYTDIAFHRIVPTHPSGMPFVIQAGDPIGSGSGGPGVFIDLEPSNLEHAFGVLSMARTQNPDTNGSQFFVALSREATVHLNGAYTAFGEAIEGAQAILAVERTPLADARSGQPVEAPRIRRAELIDAPPFGTGPKPLERPAPSGER